MGATVGRDQPQTLQEQPQGSGHLGGLLNQEETTGIGDLVRGREGGGG